MGKHTHTKSTGVKKKGRRRVKTGPSPEGGDAGDSEMPEISESEVVPSSKESEEVEAVPQADSEAQDKEDDEDDGPEQVLLVRGKDDALERKRLENAAVKRVKLSMKEKRRLKAEMFKKQKEAKQLKTLSKFPEGALEKALSKIADQRAEKKKIDEKTKSPSPEVEEPTVPTQVGSVKVVLNTNHSEMASDTGTEHAQNLEEHQHGTRLKIVVPASQFPKKNPRKPAANFVTHR